MSEEIKHFREAVAKFDELKLELEDLKEDLDKNFENYKNVSDISSDIAEKNQSVLESINILQINAENSAKDAIEKAENLKAQMAEYYSAEYGQTKKNLDALLRDMNSSINSLRNGIGRDIQMAISNAHIDTSSIEIKLAKEIKNIKNNVENNFRDLEQKINEIDLNKLDRKTDDYIKIIQYKDKQIKELITLSQKTNTDIKEIKNASKSIQKYKKNISFVVFMTALVIGVIGGSISTAVVMSPENSELGTYVFYGTGIILIITWLYTMLSNNHD